jgi:hypothetical protein
MLGMSIPESRKGALEMTEAQTQAVEALREGYEISTHEPCSVAVTEYGSAGFGCILALLSFDTNPAPNPVKALWENGSAHIVRSERDYERWLEILETPTVQREDDLAFVISPGGYYVAEDDAEGIASLYDNLAEAL